MVEQPAKKSTPDSLGGDATGHRPALLWISLSVLIVAVVFVSVLGLAGWLLLVRPAQATVTPAEKITAYFDLAKISLAVVAAFGAAVGLVVAYRRQQTMEDSHTLMVQTERRVAAETAARNESSEEEANRDRMRLLNERFTSASAQLGSERVAIRLAGVYAMAGLADDWEDHRQTCIDVLCGYFRMSSAEDKSEEEVRNGIFQVIRDHFSLNAQTRWSGMSFNFRGASFTGQDLSDIEIDGAKFDFRYATIKCLTLARSRLLNGDLDFEEATIAGTLEFTGIALREEFTVNLSEVRFDPVGIVTFSYVNMQDNAAIFLTGDLTESGEVSFGSGRFLGGRLDLDLTIDGGRLNLDLAELSGGVVKWGSSLFQRGTIIIPENTELAHRLRLPIDRANLPTDLFVETSR